MTELEKKAYTYAIDRLADSEYPRYNYETEIADAYEQGYKDAIGKACEFFEARMLEMCAPDDNYIVVDGYSKSKKDFIEQFKKYIK